MKNRFVIDTWSWQAVTSNSIDIYWVKDHDNGDRSVVSIADDGILTAKKVEHGTILEFSGDNKFLSMPKSDFNDMINQLSESLSAENSELKKVSEYKEGILSAKNETIDILKEITHKFIENNGK